MRIIKNTVLFILIILLLACKSKKQSSSTITKIKPTKSISESEQVEPTIGLGLGNKAPAIELKNLKDSVIKLSSIKGKLVLIDFWASWCGPCRYENPFVVDVYHKYKNKNFKGGNGFTIYSVSLDSDKNRWKQAIDNDSLVWPYHVSDLKMWGSEVVSKYNLQGIPTNVLIDERGVIVGKDLRGEALIDALEKQVLK